MLIVESPSKAGNKLNVVWAKFSTLSLAGFVMITIVWHLPLHPCLEFKTLLWFRPVSLRLSLYKSIKARDHSGQACLGNIALGLKLKCSALVSLYLFVWKKKVLQHCHQIVTRGTFNTSFSVFPFANVWNKMPFQRSILFQVNVFIWLLARAWSTLKKCCC